MPQNDRKAKNSNTGNCKQITTKENRGKRNFALKGKQQTNGGIRKQPERLGGFSPFFRETRGQEREGKVHSSIRRSKEFEMKRGIHIGGKRGGSLTGGGKNKGITYESVPKYEQGQTSSSRKQKEKPPKVDLAHHARNMRTQECWGETEKKEKSPQYDKKEGKKGASTEGPQPFRSKKRNINTECHQSREKVRQGKAEIARGKLGGRPGETGNRFTNSTVTQRRSPCNGKNQT